MWNLPAIGTKMYFSRMSPGIPGQFNSCLPAGFVRTSGVSEVREHRPSGLTPRPVRPRRAASDDPDLVDQVLVGFEVGVRGLIEDSGLFG